MVSPNEKFSPDEVETTLDPLGARVAAMLGYADFAEVSWDESGRAIVAWPDDRPRPAAAATGLLLGDGAVDLLINNGSLSQLPEPALVLWLAELRRVARSALWLSLPAAGRCDRACWERRLFAAGFRKHPGQMDAVGYEQLEHEPDLLIFLVEPLPPSALELYPLATLQAERDLHMDMARETGRRSDAHLARYHLARRYLPSTGVVLDVACGLGYGTAMLAAGSNARVVGIDNSEFAIAYARVCYGATLPNAGFEVGDACDLARIPDESVDLVVSFETIEHLRKPERFLAEVRRVLKPGGRLIGSVPNQWVDEQGRDPNPWHFHVFDFAKLAGLCGNFLSVEQAFRQTAGGGMRLNRAPRELRSVNLPVAEDQCEAEWWLIAAAKPRGAATGGCVLALTADAGHPHFSSWLPALGLPVVATPQAGVDFVFPTGTELVVAADCYHQPNVTLLRRAVEQGIPTLILADGILEYRNTWEHPQLAPGALFQPVLGHKLACLGRSQARIVESWGNAGSCEIVGAPRLDRYASIRRRVRESGQPWRLLVMTALTPYFTAGQHALVRQGLLDLKAHLEGARAADGSPVEVVWRVTKGLETELDVGVPPAALAGRELAEILMQVDAVVTTPSTAMLEAMLLGLPVATLDYCNVPAYVPAAWRITAEAHIVPTLAALGAPDPARMLYQDTVLHDALECATPAAARMVELARRMITHGRDARAANRPLSFAPRLLASPIIAEGEARCDLAYLFPDAPQFAPADPRALQVEIGQLRRALARLESGGAAKLTESSGAERLHRFITHLADARRPHGEADQVAIWEVAMDGTSRRALLLAPPVALEFSVPTGCAGRFVAAVALHPDNWRQSQSGPCEFIVRIDGRLAYAIALDPTNVPQDRGWIEIQLVVPSSRAGRHQVHLETVGIGSDAYRWALWRDPHFVWSESLPP